MFKYVAIDIETTGLDPEKHQILEFAAIFDDLSLENLCEPVELLPTFTRKIRWDDYVINHHCLEMHYKLLEEIEEEKGRVGTDVICIDYLACAFRRWLIANGIRSTGYNVAGKNFSGFDGLFLKQIPNFPEWNYRILDVGSMYLIKEMDRLPGLTEIERIEKDKMHRALPDAQAVVRAVRRKLVQ